MPGAKKSLPAPIDRPLSRAYLRQFKGWSTQYPPGLSDPASLRIMENVMVGRDTGLRVRPGLKYLSFVDEGPLLGYNLVGTHEVFFLNDGTKAYLFAANDGAAVRFLVATYTGDPDIPFEVTPAEDTFDMVDPATDLDDPEAIWFTTGTTYVKYLQIDNKILALSDNGEQLRLFYVGETKKAVRIQSITVPEWNVGDKLTVGQPHPDWIASPTGPASVTFATRTGDTLISSDDAENTYNFGYFYTIFNELGESAPSQVSTIRAQRHWSNWIWEEPTLFGSSTPQDPATFADQIVAVMPEDVFTAAYNAGALGWNLYMANWSNNDPIPIEAILIGTIPIVHEDPGDPPDPETAYDLSGIGRHLAAVGQYNKTAPMPTLATRQNYSDPSRGGNGLVAADRMVLVYDPAAPAVIRWSSNLQGDYLNFSARVGGGYKTLTSGNLYIPAAVKLWQNPQSVDSLIILCRGIDGMSTGYYMAPSEITSQSESTTVMGFEETTATPGTTSPFGCEVYNNALYHPIEEQLMKSTAANYAIRHKSLTDLIARNWTDLESKETIVSCEYDGRIYYIVNNPDGEELEPFCNGNEIWVLDAQVEAPNWSRWLVQAVSLRKIGHLGQVMLSVVRPDGIYCFDAVKPTDDVVTVLDELENRAIPWRIETNTQGANRAHDAWAYVQFASVTFGNLNGVVTWGMRGKDVNGKEIDIHKMSRGLDPAPDGLPYDFEDPLQIRRVMKEWYFYASNDVDGTPSPSFGQIDLVQYRYTPSTVNTGYENGSVETFEYGRDTAGAASSNTVQGVPVPFADTSQP